MSPRARKRSVSEQPADLRAERETFVRSFLHKGVELTEGLLRENQTLQARASQLEHDNTQLRAQLASKDVVRDLLGAIQELEGERTGILGRIDELERVSAQHEVRNRTLEQELNDLASLYVASFQLGSSLSVRHVMRHLCELLEQLVGAQSFVVYALSKDGKTASPVASRGVLPKQLKPKSTAEGPLGDVCLTGVPRILDPVPAPAGDEPIAVVPLLFDAEVVGVISVHALLPHKRAWALVDHELFKLLCAQGASALIGANLYARAPGPRAALEGLAVHLAGKSNGAAKIAKKKAKKS